MQMGAERAPVRLNTAPDEGGRDTMDRSAGFNPRAGVSSQLAGPPVQ
jgi:hypothetical protein